MIEFIKNIKIQAVLAFFVLVCCFGMLCFTDTSEILQARLFDVMLVVISFYFGASHGSAAKNKIIERLADKQP